MGTNPIGHYHGRLTFIGCCYYCTDQKKPSPGWSKCGRAFMDMDKIDLSYITKDGGNNNNNSKDGVCLWSAEILDCCLRGKSKPRGSCSQSFIDWPYWNHFIVYRCSSACSLSPGSSRASIKPATLMSGTSHANNTSPMDYFRTHAPIHKPIPVFALQFSFPIILLVQCIFVIEEFGMTVKEKERDGARQKDRRGVMHTKLLRFIVVA